MSTLTDGEVERFVVAERGRFTWARCREDIAPFLTRHVTWRALAAGDIRSKYRRTMLGPWWITATNAITALIMGAVAGRFLGADMKTYLPHFMVSMTIWNFIASSLGESCYTMINAGGMIKAVDMPILIHVMRMVQRNLIIFLHNIAIIPIIWLIYPWPIGIVSLLSLFGLALVYVFIVSTSTIVSMICVRYRDVPPVMNAIIQLLFFVSPIIWAPSQIKGGELAVALNPIAYLLAITRDPLMGHTPNLASWAGAAGFIAVLTAAMIYIYTRYRSRVVYWA
ncbi:putative O-antigene/LPS export system permease protein [Bradyrhizobium sp. ORS 278]|uniref:ABC transporter permease n=1 Tax=Bradyrhizobium sp. (strain ORS 278) TaxID=114615 RepID=UPI00015088C5|nr:ABC transporter permease [Bradyrhizobium sp. ORS 278]CAL78872.1 putative O-antigene/LPS export system permease protein [Bradyrhizobium sp. ORS 278]